MPLTDKQKQAAQLILDRREARRDMVAWSRVCGFEPALHHRYMIDQLTKVVAGTVTRLMIFLPPGSAKSTYSSVLFPPWYLAQKKDTTILACSHGSDLAEEFGRRSRNLIDLNSGTLGYKLRSDSKGSSRWETTNGGMFFCAGVGGKIAGRRADIAFIDDPVGSREDAYSKTMRDKVWNWYNFDFRPRWKPNCRTILIQTRWHEDDLAGRLLETEGDEWEVIRIPLLAEGDDVLGRQPGDRLWPEYFTERDVVDRKKDKAVFSALNQQRPQAEEGEYFKREWIEKNSYSRDEMPKELNKYGASDHAVSLREEADFTCAGVGGVDTRDVLYIMPEILWEKVDSMEAVTGMIRLMKLHKLKLWWAEQGHISKAIGPFLERQMRAERVYTLVEERTPSKDKQTRAQSIRARMKMGMVRLPNFAPWYEAAVDQMVGFPAGKHDDFVDFIAHLGLGLDDMQVASTPLVKHQAPNRLTFKWLKEEDRKARQESEAYQLINN